MSHKSLHFLILLSMYFLTSTCFALGNKPPFTPTTEFDGKYKGDRIDVSGDSICKKTRITGKVKNGKATFWLQYNGTRLTGWISESGELELESNSDRWDYKFSGSASGNTIAGKWSVGNAPCRGTWEVTR